MTNPNYHFDQAAPATSKALVPVPAARARLSAVAKARWNKVRATRSVRKQATLLPKANALGVYSDKDAERLYFAHKKLHADVKLLQLKGGEWICSASYRYEGTGVGCGAGQEPLMANEKYVCREDALLAATDKILKYSGKANGAGWVTPEQRIAADAMGRWAHKLRKDVRRQRFNG